MLTLNELKQERDIINAIDWSMTPEKAVDMYLEWGAGWTRGNDFVTGNDISVYFVLYDWESPPQVTLLKRSMKEVVELARIPVPADLFHETCAENGRKPGGSAHGLSDRLKQWLMREIGG